MADFSKNNADFRRRTRRALNKVRKFESLEARSLLKATLYLDFDPTDVPGSEPAVFPSMEGQSPKNFDDIFSYDRIWTVIDGGEIPPNDPGPNVHYLVSIDPTKSAKAAWSNEDNKLATWNYDSELKQYKWTFRSPEKGATVAVQSFSGMGDVKLHQYNGSSWLFQRTFVAKGVLERHRTTPPTAPATGDTYIVPADALGLWNRKTNQLAIWNGRKWNFSKPKVNDVVPLAIDGQLYKFNGHDWIANGPVRYTPLFLDSLGGTSIHNKLLLQDGRLNHLDADFAKASIGTSISNYLSEIAGKFISVEIVSDGWKILSEAKERPGETAYVLFIADSHTSESSPLGIAQSEYVGQDGDKYGFVFADRIATNMAVGTSKLNRDSRIQRSGSEVLTSDFATNVANTALHEFGHMLGLGHPLVNNKKTENGVTVEKWKERVQTIGTSAHFDSLMDSGFKRKGTRFRKEAIPSVAVRHKYSADCDNEFSSDKTTNSRYCIQPQLQQKEIIDSLKAANTSEGPPESDLLTGRDTPFVLERLEADDAESEPAEDFVPPLLESPPATLGTLGNTTSADIARQLGAGFQQLDGTFFQRLANGLNLAPTSIPLIQSDISTKLGIGKALLGNRPQLNLSGLKSTTELRNALEAAGFTIQHLITDQELEFANKNQPLDLVRARVRLLSSGLQGESAINHSSLDGLSFLQNVILSGKASLDASAAAYLTVGVDTGGFYILPGKMAEAGMLAEGEARASAGSVDIGFNPSLHVTVSTSLNTTHSDGRIRLTDLTQAFSKDLSTTFSGAAVVEIAADVPVFGQNPLAIQGQWVWDFDKNGIVLDQAYSGFDETGFRGGMLDTVGEALNELSSEATTLSTIADRIPLIGDELSTVLEPLFSSTLEYDRGFDSAEEYLAARGMVADIKVSPTDFFDGTWKDKDLISLRYGKSLGSGTKALEAFGTWESSLGDVKFAAELSGQINADANVTVDIMLGVDAIGGVYIQEGSLFKAGANARGLLRGDVNLGNIAGIHAEANAALASNVSFVYSDFDDQPNERIYLFKGGSLDIADIVNGFSQATLPADYNFDGNISLDVKLAIDTPANDVPILGALLDNALVWRASVLYDLSTRQGKYDIDQGSLPSFANLESRLRDEFLRLADKYNPLPQNFRDFLTMDVALLGNKSLTDLLNFGAADFIINPRQYVGRDLPAFADDPSEHIKLKYDFASPQNIVKLLSGQDADLLSLDFKQHINALNTGDKTIVNDAPIATFFGVVNATLGVSVNAQITMDMQGVLGLSTRGFYIRDDEQKMFSLKGCAGATVTLSGTIGPVPIVSVDGSASVCAYGDLDIRNPTPTGAQSRVMAEDLFHNGSINVDVFSFGLGANLAFDLQGHVGIDTLRVSTEKYRLADFELFRVEFGGRDAGSEQFEDLSRDLQERATYYVCGAALLSPNPITVAGCGILLLPNLKKAWDNTVKWAEEKWGKLEDAVGKSIQTLASAGREVEKFVSQKLATFDDAVRDVVDKIGLGGVVDTLADLKGAIFGTSWERIEVSPKFTFDSKLEGRSLIVDWNTTNSARYLNTIDGELTIDVIDNMVVIAGPQFTTREQVAKRKYDCWDGCNTETRDGDIQHRNLATYEMGSFDEIWVRGSDGNDVFILTGNVGIPARLEGRGGKDKLVGGRLRDVLLGGEGDDTLLGEEGNDVLSGGGGSDTIFGGSGDDNYSGGAGNDLFDERTGEGERSLESNKMLGEEGDDILYGSPGADEIDGGSGRDMLYGGAGMDKLFGDRLSTVATIPSAEADFIDGGDGDDKLEGGAGDDRLEGGDGNDEIRGGWNDDQLFAAAGDDKLFGEQGDDVLRGEIGADELFGGGGADILYGGDGNDSLYGSNQDNSLTDDGNDALFGEAGTDKLFGSKSGPGLPRFAGGQSSFGFDLLDGGDGPDEIKGGEGPERLVGGDGNDKIEGNGGDDEILGIFGVDHLNGGQGNDKLVAGDGAGSTLDGGPGDDLLAGSPGADRIFGREGNDKISGRAGSDYIEANEGDAEIFGDDSGLDEVGNDIIFGGAGNNMVDAGGGNNQVTAYSGNDVIIAGAGNDVVDAGDGRNNVNVGDGSNFVRTGAGSDDIKAGRGDDTIQAGDGEDIVDAGDGNNAVLTGAGNDQISAGKGDDDIRSGSGDDGINAGDGNNQVYAGEGADSVLTGSGDDFIVGSKGNDIIRSGAGRDMVWGGDTFLDLSDFIDLLSNQAINTTNPGLFPGAEWNVTISDLKRDDFWSVQNVPIRVNQLSIAGYSDDGEDTILGGPATDWLFGGGQKDVIDGGDGSDYIDGGSGPDDLSGGRDADIVRGGLNDDVIRGNHGLDQLYGDEGADTLFGDAGDGTSQQGQRLFGGPGEDSLYAYAGSPSASDAPGNYSGDELHGGSGADSLYGNVLGERMYGDAGADRLLGDWLAGSFYTINSSADKTGSGDKLFGGFGEDNLFGGGGNDELWGGGDGDRLEGQDGSDKFYGGGYIDLIVLDTSDKYKLEQNDQFYGHFGNESKGDVPDDNATDIVQINGTNDDDIIQLNQTKGNTSKIDFTISNKVGQRTLSFDWRDSPSLGEKYGAPRVEQFRIAGLGANDTITFGTGDAAPFFDDLSERSEDWVTVIDGNDGNDTVKGTGGRDRIDGGSGSDILYGLGGDDQLWGDNGPSSGQSGDKDTIYGGTGDDDLIGGQGKNLLYAWSSDPAAIPGKFGVYTSDGNLEDTGLNRVLGGPNADSLYGGTGLDFLYGNGGDDTLYDRNNKPFESRDGGIAGDEWKNYAKSSQKVWYYGGSNANDDIRINYVTEPGLFTGHHLITRLTTNLGQSTFDAQIRLDYNARTPDGSLVWNSGVSLSSDPIPFALVQSGGRLNADTSFAVSVDGLAPITVLVKRDANNTLLEHLVQDINQALEDAHLSGRVQARLLGSIDKDSATGASREEYRIVLSLVGLLPSNDSSGSANSLSITNGSAELGLSPSRSALNASGKSGLEGLLPPEDDYLAIIVDALDGDDAVTVGPTVTRSVWVDAGKGHDRVEINSGDSLLIDQAERTGNGTTRNDRIEILSGDTNGDRRVDISDFVTLRREFGKTVKANAGEYLKADFNSDHKVDLGDFIAFRSKFGSKAGNLTAFSLNDGKEIESPVTYSGLTIDNPNDVDWYQVSVNGEIRLSTLSLTDDLSVDVYDVTGVHLLETIKGAKSTYVWSSQGTGQYLLRVSSDQKPTRYELEFAPPENKAVRQSLLLQPSKDDHVDGLVLAASGAYTFEVTADKSPHVVTLQLLESAFVSSDTTQFVTVAVTGPQGNVVEFASVDTRTGLASITIPAVESGAGKYTLSVENKSTTVPVRFALTGAKRANATQQLTLDRVDLSGKLPGDNRRKDIVLGGEGNDIIQGGPGEDWIFGGPGNDVLSGGYDRQAGDLIWGGENDDRFQILPDLLPLALPSRRYISQDQQQTIIPTMVDRFDGQEGNDQVLFWGGDLDTNGREVPDSAAVRYNSILHRYELASRVWDVQNQRFVDSETETTSSSITGTTTLPESGQLLPAIAARGKLNLPNTDPTERLTETITIEFEEARRTTIEVELKSSASQVIAGINRALDANAETSGRLSAFILGDNKLAFKLLTSQTPQIYSNGNRLGLELTNGKPNTVETERQRLTFDVTIGSSGKPVSVTIDFADTADNRGIGELISDINVALRSAKLHDQLEATSRSGTLVLREVDAASPKGLSITIPSQYKLTAETLLGLKDSTAVVIKSQAAVTNVAFFQTLSTENFHVDLRAGNDEFHADPEYTFQNDTSEWGFDVTDRPQNGILANRLKVIGGSGDDRIFGGAGDDTLDGGLGQDVVVGGGGNDQILGGDGDDHLEGGTREAAQLPDAYEYSNRGSNDSPINASIIREGTVNASVSETDKSDWYLLVPDEPGKTANKLKDLVVLDSFGVRVEYYQGFGRWTGASLSLVRSDKAALSELASLDFVAIKVSGVGTYTISLKQQEVANKEVSRYRFDLAPALLSEVTTVENGKLIWNSGQSVTLQHARIIDGLPEQRLSGIELARWPAGTTGPAPDRYDDFVFVRKEANQAPGDPSLATDRVVAGPFLPTTNANVRDLSFQYSAESLTNPAQDLNANGVEEQWLRTEGNIRIVDGNNSSQTELAKIIPSAGHKFIGNPKPIGDIGSPNSSEPDGYPDAAVFEQPLNGSGYRIRTIFGGSDEIVVGSSAISIAATPLAVVSGDYNGDSQAELVVLTSDNTAALFSRTQTAWEQKLSISGDAANALDSLTSTPFLDLNADGLSDIVLGASRATVFGTDDPTEAGRVFIFYGSRNGTALPEGADKAKELSNTSIAGSGSFLVNTANGKPFETAPIPVPSASAWHKFTTLGDGLPGNFIEVTPSKLPQGQVNIPLAAATAYTNSGAFASSSINGSPLEVSSSEVAVLHFNISPLLPYLPLNGTPDSIQRTLNKLLLALDIAADAADNFEVQVLSEEGGLLTSPKHAGIVSADQTLTRISGTAQELATKELPITALTSAVQKGLTTLVVRVASKTGKAFRIYAPDTQPLRSGNDSGTQLVATTASDGFTLELRDSAGGVIDKDKPLIDMRNLDAGTYYVQVIGPTNTRYTIVANAPFAGQSRAQFALLDRDEIQGGLGRDYLSGGGDLDQVFADSDDRTVLAEDVEIRTGAKSAGPLDGESLNDSLPTRTIDPLVNVTDDGLKLALSQALNIPLRQSANGLQFVRELHASDLAELTFLDASNRGLGSDSTLQLLGLEHAVNLRGLFLGGNQLTSLESIRPRISTTFEYPGQELGARGLAYLSIDGNRIDSLAPLEQMTNLAAISADNTFVSSIEPLRGLDSLQWLSIDGQPNYAVDDVNIVEISTERSRSLAGLSSLSLRNQAIENVDFATREGMGKLNRLSLDGNRISDATSLVRTPEQAKQWDHLSLTDNPLNNKSIKVLSDAKLSNVQFGLPVEPPLPTKVNGPATLASLSNDYNLSATGYDLANVKQTAWTSLLDSSEKVVAMATDTRGNTLIVHANSGRPTYSTSLVDKAGIFKVKGVSTELLSNKKVAIAVDDSGLFYLFGIKPNAATVLLINTDGSTCKSATLDTSSSGQPWSLDASDVMSMTFSRDRLFITLQSDSQPFAGEVSRADLLASVAHRVEVKVLNLVTTESGRSAARNLAMHGNSLYYTESLGDEVMLRSRNLVNQTTRTLGSFARSATTGGGSVEPTQLMADAQGNLYLAGQFSGNIDFDLNSDREDVRTSNGGKDGFVSKIVPNGDVAWTSTFGGAADDFLTSIAIDNRGNVFLSGFHSSSGNSFSTNPVHFAGVVATPKPNDTFVAMLDAQGSYQWLESLNSQNQSPAITISPANGHIVVGRTENGNGSISSMEPLGFHTVQVGTQTRPQVERALELIKKRLGEDTSDMGDVMVIPHQAISGREEFTLELWFQPNLLADGPTKMPLFSAANRRAVNTSSDGNLFEVSYMPSVDGLPKLELRTAGNATSKQIPFPASFLGQQDAWHHVALSVKKDSSNRYVATLILNGRSVGQLATSSNPQEVTDIAIGQRATGLAGAAGGYGTEYFTGLIDEIRIWSTPKSSDDIRSNLHRRLAGKETGLEAYYSFNDIDVIPGTDIVLDRSGKFRTARLGDDNEQPRLSDDQNQEAHMRSMPSLFSTGKFASTLPAARAIIHGDKLVVIGEPSTINSPTTSIEITVTTHGGPLFHGDSNGRTSCVRFSAPESTDGAHEPVVVIDCETGLPVYNTPWVNRSAPPLEAQTHFTIAGYSWMPMLPQTFVDGYDNNLIGFISTAADNRTPKSRVSRAPSHR